MKEKSFIQALQGMTFSQEDIIDIMKFCLARMK